MISSADDLRARNREREARWAVCRAAAMARDGWRCWAEVLQRAGWMRCGKRNGETSHVYKRTDCGEAWADVEVVVRLCRDCHRLLHAHDTGVRIPRFIKRRAWDALVIAHRDGRLKVMPSGGRP